MIETKCSFLEVAGECPLGNTIELGEPAPGIAPEAFNADDIPCPAGELAGFVIDPEVPIEADLHQPAITALATHPACAEAGFIHRDPASESRILLADLGKPLVHLEEHAVDGTNRNPGKYCRASGGKIQGKSPRKLAIFRPTDSRSDVVPVCSDYFKKLSHLGMCLVSHFNRF